MYQNLLQPHLLRRQQSSPWSPQVKEGYCVGPDSRKSTMDVQPWLHIRDTWGVFNIPCSGHITGTEFNQIVQDFEGENTVTVFMKLSRSPSKLILRSTGLGSNTDLGISLIQPHTRQPFVRSPPHSASSVRPAQLSCCGADFSPKASFLLQPLSAGQLPPL